MLLVSHYLISLKESGQYNDAIALEVDVKEFVNYYSLFGVHSTIDYMTPIETKMKYYEKMSTKSLLGQLYCSIGSDMYLMIEIKCNVNYSKQFDHPSEIVKKKSTTHEPTLET